MASPLKGRTFAPEVLTVDEILALLEAAGRSATGTRNRALLVVLWRAGLRVGEALELEPADVDQAAGTVRVPRGKTGHRTVGLDPEALAVVAEWTARRRPGRGRLFCTLAGKPLGANYVRVMLKRLAERAGIRRRVHPHAFRHTHAAELVREGANVRHLQLQLGHRDLATTATYLQAIQPLELVELARNRPGWGGGSQ